MAEAIPADWHQRYANFLNEDGTREAIRRGAADAFFRAYPRVVNSSTPTARFTVPLAQARIGLVSTGGVHLPGQVAFAKDSLFGDTSVRVLPMHRPAGRWAISHGHYDETSAREDINCVLPIAPLKELVAAGKLGAVTDHACSIDGYCTDAAGLLEDAGSHILQTMRDDGADAVLLVPV